MEGLELEHRIDLFQTKIGVALSALEEGRTHRGIELLKGALKWDKEVYQEAHKTTEGKV